MLDVADGQSVLFAQRKKCRERRLDRVTDRERLDRSFLDIEAAAEVGNHLLGRRLNGLSVDEVTLTVECVEHTREARLDHRRPRDTVTRTHATEIKSFFDVLDIANPAPDA